ncbi:MAG: N-acetylglucosamine kinase [Jatrophihabitans sp.]
MDTTADNSQSAVIAGVQGERRLAIDVGKSQVRIKLASATGDIAAATEPGYHHAAHADGVDGVLAVLRPAVSRIPDRPDRCVLAATGLSSEPDDRQRLLRGVVDAVCASAVAVCDDFVAAHAGALARPGTILIAGTGAIAFSVRSDGTSGRVDGWGPHLGDDGGAYALGRSGLHAAFASVDGRGPATDLSDRALQYLGGLDIQAAYRLHARDDAVAAVSGFAPEVAQAAATGDRVAERVLAEAVAALASTAASGAAQSGSPVVSWSGRLFDLGAQLVDPLAAALAAVGVQLIAPAGTPLDGAMALCTPRSSLYTSMLTATPDWVTA